ncbi:MAG: GerMN domain-containing protein [Candidatus Aminicenantales bacterium]
MTRKRITVLSFLSILLVFLVVIFITKTGPRRITKRADSLSRQISEKGEEKRENKKVTLFFLSERDSNLHPEQREIFTDEEVEVEAKQVIKELIKGSEKEYLTPLPPETQLREVFVTRDGTAYVDFTRSIQEGNILGSSAEISTVYAIVNSLTYNFKQIRRVYIMVEGMEKETLGGHINISRPLLPKYDLISR